MSRAHTEKRLRSLAWARERVAYSREQIADIFGMSPNESGNLILTLMNEGILSQRRKFDRTEQADESALESFIGSGDYAFSYVGMYCHRGHLVYVMPKYYTEDALMEPELALAGGALPTTRMNVFAQVIKVIARYQSKYENVFSDALHERESTCYLALLVSLLCDYAEHGEYREDVDLISRNGSGRILWNRTINTTTPFMQDGTPVYVDVDTCRTIDAEDHFITRLHRVIVKECYRQLELFSLPELLELPHVETIEENIEELGETDFLLHCVESELNQQFDSRRRHILQLMQTYLHQRFEQDELPEYSFSFGCTHFHTVWEDVCRCSLGVDVKSRYGIQPPRWSICDGAAADVQPLKLDMLFVKEGVAYVFDAKYYLPEIINGRVSRLPGVNDVTKQFLYAIAVQKKEALSTPPELLPHTVCNAFLMPLPVDGSRTAEVEYYADIEMGLFSGMRIKVFRLQAAQLYEAYLTHRKCNWPECLFSLTCREV